MGLFKPKGKHASTTGSLPKIIAVEEAEEKEQVESPVVAEAAIEATTQAPAASVEPEPLVTSSDGFVKVKSIDENPIPTLEHFTIRGENVGYKSRDPDHGLPDHGLMGALATVAGQPLSWHCTAFDNDRASEATFQSDGSAEELEPGEYTAALTLNYAVDDGTGDSHLEPLVIENVRFKVGE